MYKWDSRFLNIAREISTWSKDPSKKIGAVFVSVERRILATGYNGFPQGIGDSEDRYLDRDIKYAYVVHAEKNAIYNATYHGITLKDSTLYVWGLPVCSECAKGVIQVGTKRVVMPSMDSMGFVDETREKWIHSWELSHSLFREALIDVDFVDI
jgi:dCMP deaminase